MLQYVNVDIDGALIRAVRGASVLDTAIEYGICIPHLCHVPHLSDIGACRLCIVEHVRNGRSTVTTSCTLKVEEGMVIMTNTDKLRPIQVGLSYFAQEQGTEYGLMMAAATFCVAPIVIIYFIAQKQVIESYAKSGIKG